MVARCVVCVCKAQTLLDHIKVISNVVKVVTNFSPVR
jgi:hypothetical protein